MLKVRGASGLVLQNHFFIFLISRMLFLNSTCVLEFVKRLSRMEDSIFLLSQILLSKISFNHWKLMRYFDRWIVHQWILIVASLSVIVSWTVWICLKVARRMKKNVSFYRSAERKLCTCIKKGHSVHFEEIKSSERMIVLQVISCGRSLFFFHILLFSKSRRCRLDDDRVNRVHILTKCRHETKNLERHNLHHNKSWNMVSLDSLG